MTARCIDCHYVAREVDGPGWGSQHEALVCTHEASASVVDGRPHPCSTMRLSVDVPLAPGGCGPTGRRWAPRDEGKDIPVVYRN